MHQQDRWEMSSVTLTCAWTYCLSSFIKEPTSKQAKKMLVTNLTREEAFDPPLSFSTSRESQKKKCCMHLCEIDSTTSAQKQRCNVKWYGFFPLRVHRKKIQVFWNKNQTAAKNAANDLNPSHLGLMRPCLLEEGKKLQWEGSSEDQAPDSRYRCPQCTKHDHSYFLENRKQQEK